MASSSSDDDFSVFVLASDLGVDGRPFLQDKWHDCPSHLDDDSPDDIQNFADLDALQFLSLQPAFDKSANRIFRIVGKYFPAPVVDAERLKKYVVHKISNEMPEGPFCIVYMHTTVQKEDNSPGMSILRWIYEELTSDIKDRLQVVYFIHPGLRSRLVFATLGRLLLSGGLYWKIKYISRLEYLWEDVKKGDVDIPQFVQDHDKILENRPLTDYGIEPDPLHLTAIPSAGYPFGRFEDRWSSREYMS